MSKRNCTSRLRTAQEDVPRWALHSNPVPGFQVDQAPTRTSFNLLQLKTSPSFWKTLFTRAVLMVVFGSCFLGHQSRTAPRTCFDELCYWPWLVTVASCGDWGLPTSKGRLGPPILEHSSHQWQLGASWLPYLVTYSLNAPLKTLNHGGSIV